MSNEAKEYVQQWCGDAFPYFPEKFSAHEVFTLMERYAQDRTPPDPDAHIEDQEQYLEAKSKRFEARTEGESTAEVERAMKGEPSPSILPVFTEEEIGRIAWTLHRSDPAATYRMGINGTMAAHAGACLRYANGRGYGTCDEGAWTIPVVGPRSFRFRHLSQ